MSERDGYQPGVPCWVDTWQPNADATAGFYAGIFGWETEGPPGGPFVCKLRSRDVAMVGQLPPEHSHRPSAWMTHVWVESADETAARVSDAGGTIAIEPFESLDGGRIAIVADPAGAHLGVWQVGAHRGAELVNEPGAWSWAQLYTRDPASAPPFYAKVFGWEPEPFGELTMFRLPGYVGGEPEQPVPRDVVAGMAPMGDEFPADMPSHWRIDFWVDDVDATVAKAEELGGRTVVPAFDSEIFRQAVLADPRGADFSITKITIGE
jgi:predicted enzyme related to lactoylglutathione lyase